MVSNFADLEKKKRTERVDDAFLLCCKTLYAADPFATVT